MLIVLSGIGGCAPTTPTPPPLPQLKTPIPDPPPPTDRGEIRDLEVAVQSMDGEELSELTASSPFTVSAQFQWSNPPAREHRRIAALLVQYVEGRPVIAAEKSLIPDVNDAGGRCDFTLELKAPPVPGEFHLILQFPPDDPFDERKIVVAPKDET